MKSNLLNSAFLGLLGVLAAAPAFAQIKFDLMHTDPACKHKGYQPTFCEMTADMKDADQRSGMIDKINAQLDRALQNPKTSKVYIAYFSMSNKGVHKKICELLGQKVPVRIVLDQGSSTNVSDLKANAACAGKDLSSLKTAFLGGLTSSPWRLHHNKFLFVDPGTGEDVNVNFSSGNLSSFGTSLHMDHWVTMLAPKKSNLVRAYECVMQGLDSAVKYAEANGGHNGNNDEDVAQNYIEARENCFKKTGVNTNVNLAVSQEKIAPLFSPNNDNIVYKTLSREIGMIPKGGYIYIAIQHFLHPGIGSDLIQASKRGVDVRIIMDDDVVTNKGEVQGAMDFLNGLKAQAPRIAVRYIETNHLAGGNGSMMHNKFAILNGRRILSGAGQYTGAAMKKNWENFGLIEDAELTRKYALYFKKLWQVSVDEDYVRAQLPFNEVINDSPNSNHVQPPIEEPEDFNISFKQLVNSK